MTATAPPTRRGDVVDVLHGESVPDPYRWLEDTDSAETAAWVKEQNAGTSAYLETLPGRDDIRDRLTELWHVTRYGVPYEHGGKWFFTRHDPDADQPMLRVADQPDGDGRVLLDPNALVGGRHSRADVLDGDDGRQPVAYATEQRRLRLDDVAGHRRRDRRDLPDVVEWSKFGRRGVAAGRVGLLLRRPRPAGAGRGVLADQRARRLQLHRSARRRPTTTAGLRRPAARSASRMHGPSTTVAGW